MVRPDGRTLIPVSEDLKDKLKVLVAQGKFRSYEELLISLLRDKGLWTAEDDKKEEK